MFDITGVCFSVFTMCVEIELLDRLKKL